MVATVAEEFSVMIQEGLSGWGKNVYIFSAPDHAGKLTTEEYIRFMNKLAKYLDDNYTFASKITLLMLAYNNTLIAPTYTDELKFYSSNDVNIAVMYAPIYASMYRSISDDTKTSAYYGKHTNAYYLQQLQAWKQFGGELYYWNYSTYYDNYFVPFDSITAMQGTYQALKAEGVNVLLDLGQTGDFVSANFAALKIFLKARLACNVNADVDSLIADFCDAYYGAASQNMQTLLKTERDWCGKLATKVKFVTGTQNGNYTTTDGEAIGKHDGAGQLLMYKQYWDDDYVWAKNADDSMLTSWYRYTTQAIAAVNADENFSAAEKSALRSRIEVEQIPILYLSARMFSGSGNVDENTEVDTIEQVIEKAKALGVIRYSEAADGTIDKLQ